LTGPVRAALASALRLGLGGLLAVAGILKLRDPAGFAVEIGNYQLMPALAPYLAAALPATEIIVGLGLILLPAAWRRSAAMAAAVLLVAFGVAVTSAYLRGINIACGCFGGGGDAISLLTVGRNVGLLAAAVALLLLDRPEAPGVARRASQPS
jgi:putative oxidoreductase